MRHAVYLRRALIAFNGKRASRAVHGRPQFCGAKLWIARGAQGIEAESPQQTALRFARTWSGKPGFFAQRDLQRKSWRAKKCAQIFLIYWREATPPKNTPGGKSGGWKPRAGNAGKRL
jgi:hypothetical protein